MELEHFSHEHPLILLSDEEEKHDDDGERVNVLCEGCGKRISGPSYYSCSSTTPCDFFLHKSCAQLPIKMEHGMHPYHSLILLATPPPSYPGSICRCDICGGRWKNFTYNCSPCKFDVCITCAFPMEPKMEHRCHKHPLTLLRQPALFLCHACGTKHQEGPSYLCTTTNCSFWIHGDCALLPSTIKHTDDDHPLTLSYSLPHEYAKFRPQCDICHKFLILPICWVYYCGICRYFAHVNCAISNTEPFMSILLPRRENEITVEEDVDSNLIRLPVANASVNLTSHFFKELMSLQRVENKELATELNHFSHDHPLILSDVQNNNIESYLLNDMKTETIFCDGCVRPISLSAPFYNCPHDQCTTFFLHKSCAELPSEVQQYPCHPEHSLVLLPKSSLFLNLFKCNVCQLYCDGFTFACVQCQFYLDVNCAFLPGAISHEAHAHCLILSKKSGIPCSACRRWYTSAGFKFGCGTCDFNLCSECALLPRTVRHRYDEHPLNITYSLPIKDHLHEYYCEICEEELNPKIWFYYCRDCDYSFHTRCIRPIYRFAKIKYYGGTINLPEHPHLLTLVPMPWDISKCDHCGEYFDDPFFKCSHCNFKLHLTCSEKLSILP